VIDAIACERQFIDHLVPVWNALPLHLRGVFYTEAPLVGYAVAQGVTVVAPVVRENYRRGVVHGQDHPALVASIGDTKTGRIRGYTRFLFIEHGAGQSYIGENSTGARHHSYAGGEDREDTSLFMVPNHYAAALWRQRYPLADVQVVGCPKLDDLPRKDPGEPPTVAISWHWPGKQVPETDTAYGEFHRVLPDLAREFNLIGHAHPKADWPRMLASAYRRNGIEFVADFAEVCRRADVYVCDNSSTIYEFAATDRPVVLMNPSKYRRWVHHGLRFWEAATVGEQVDTPADLVPAVRRALDDPRATESQRNAALDIVYTFRSGGAQRAAEAVVQHLVGSATLSA
jgi:hypothetical protein